MPFNATPDTADPDVHRHVRQIRRALKRNDFTEAEQHCRALLVLQPHHEAALSFLSQHALQTGDIESAQTFAAQGIAALPNSAALHFHLGCAQEAAGLHAAAREAFIHAFDRDANLILARIYQGAQEEALGQGEAMLHTYGHALTLAHKTGMLNAGQDYSPQVHHRVNHAIEILQNAREAALDLVLNPLRERYGRQPLARIQRAMDVYLGKAQVQWPHPLQRPTFLLIPDLPPQAWFEREAFPFLSNIEQMTDVIREELLAVLADEADLTPYVDMPDDAPAAPFWRELNHSPRWSGYHLFRHGERVEAHCQRCPKTVAALEALPIMRVPEHSPEALFSVLKPHTHIPLHTGVVNGRLTVHLPLIVPEKCGALKAGDEARGWEVGRCLIFDDSMFHEAWNNSDQTRVVLIFDIWNPYLTQVECEAMAATVAAIGQFNRRYCGSDESQNDH